MIIVSVTLVASVVTIIDSIDMTVQTMYGYQRFFTVVTPRNALEVAPDIKQSLGNRKIHAETLTTKPAWTTVKTIFGKMPFAIFGLSPTSRDLLLQKCGLKLASGTFPEEGKPQVMMHEDIARNLHLKIGDIVLKPESEDSYAVVPTRLCGTLKGSYWLAITSEQFIDENFPVAPQGVIVTASSELQQRILDTDLDKTIDKSRCRLWSYDGLVRETRDALVSLYIIMNMVTSIVIFAIAFLTGMLTNIYFMQRIPEFATLAAIGYQRSWLLKRVFVEVAVLCAVGWIIGSIFTTGLLVLLKYLIMYPKGLLLDPLDITVYRYTLPLPVTIAVFALVPIWRRLKSLDPVSIIERRQ